MFKPTFLFVIALLLVTLSSPSNAQTNPAQPSPVLDEGAEAAVNSAEQQEPQEPQEEDLAKAELLAWAKPVQHELSSSGDDVDQALGYGVQLMLATIEADASGQDRQNTMAKLAQAEAEQVRLKMLSSSTSVPAKMIYLSIICNLPGGVDTTVEGVDACANLIALEPFKKADANNAYLVLFKQSIGANQLRVKQHEQARAQIGEKQMATAAGRKAFEKLLSGQQSEQEKKLLRELSVANRFDDYGLIYKQRIRRLFKLRPLPDSVLQKMGAQFSVIAKFFPQEDIAAWALSNALVAILIDGNSAIRFLKSDNKLAIKTKLFELALANPKTSSASLAFIEPPKDHVFLKPFDKYKNLERAKQFSPDLLLTTNWLALRPVLSKAVTQGDLAALPDALRWADAELAKVPNKSEADVANEKAERAAQLAKYKAQQEAYQKASAAITKGCTEESNQLRDSGKVTDNSKLVELRDQCILRASAAASEKIYGPAGADVKVPEPATSNDTTTNQQNDNAQSNYK